MLFVHPSGDFLPEQKTSIKIQIDNSLRLGWKVPDIVLATNFSYLYRGVKSILVSGDNYSDISPCAPIINVIVELFEKRLIEKGELYWYHDTDAYELYRINESELNLGEFDIGLVEWSSRQKLSASSFFFKSNAKDIFSLAKEVMYKYKVNEELAVNTVCTNNLLWATGSQSDARAKFVPLNLAGSENILERVKKLNITYDFEMGYIDQYDDYYHLATKPIKVVHFHFREDILLDSALYGINNLKKAIMPKSLVKIFNKHGVRRTFPKKMKNLMIYISHEKKFLGKSESLVKRQIDNSLKLGWKRQDIILLTNFPYQYQRIKTTVLNDSLFHDINEKAWKTNSIFQFLDQDTVKEVELCWYHDLDVFQLRQLEGSEIDLEGTTAGFMLDGSGKLDTGSFFFRKYSNKIFEWIRNRSCRLHTDEKTALMSLTTTNYRNINSMYKRLSKKSAKIFKHRVK